MTTPPTTAMRIASASHDRQRRRSSARKISPSASTPPWPPPAGTRDGRGRRVASPDPPTSVDRRRIDFARPCVTLGSPTGQATDGALSLSRVAPPHQPGDIPSTMGPAGGMAERTNAQLLKSCEVQASVGSNPSPSAQRRPRVPLSNPPGRERDRDLYCSRSTTGMMVGGALKLMPNSSSIGTRYPRNASNASDSPRCRTPEVCLLPPTPSAASWHLPGHPPPPGVCVLRRAGPRSCSPW